MNTVKINVSFLAGPALDWAVLTCLDYGGGDLKGSTEHYELGKWGEFSTDWAQGGPIIEREGIRLHRSATGAWWAGPEADPHRPVSGPTPLIAAMRCYVASKLGEIVEVPSELFKEEDYV